jgi:DNA-binding NarL/FixJ family response regulator
VHHWLTITAIPKEPILLVDDHALFLEGIRNLLTARGLQVVGTASDGLDALAQARALHPDVILMDIGVDLRFGHRTTAMRNYVNLAVPTMPLLVADKRGAAETKIIAWIFRCRVAMG